MRTMITRTRSFPHLFQGNSIEQWKYAPVAFTGKATDRNDCRAFFFFVAY